MRRLAPALLLALLSWGCIQRDVISVTIAQIVVQPGAAPVLQGDTLRFTASVQDADGRAFPRANVEWSVDAPEFVTIDDEGLATAVAPGSAQVQATFRGVTGTANVNIIAAPVIDADPDTAMIFGAAGAGPPQPALVQVRNGGGGSLRGLQTSITYNGPQQGWLTATLSDVRAPATVTLSAVTDSFAVGDYEATLILTSPDDDTGPTPVTVILSLTGFTVSETGAGTTVGESGTADTLNVVLDAPPDTTVVMTVTTADPTEVAATPATLTFTPADWDTPQRVVVTGVDELVADGDQAVDVSIAVDAAASDDRFDPVPTQVVSVTSVDDDTPDVTIVQTGGSTTVGEDGSTDQFTVVLDVEPLSPVVFDVARSDPTEASAGPTTITFTPADWATPQTVTVTGVNDDLIDGDIASVVTIAVDAGLSDAAFGTLATDTVDVVTTDDDVAGFVLIESAPVGGEALSQVGEDGTADTIELVLTARPASGVTLTLTPADAGEVATVPAAVTFTPGNWDSPVTVALNGVDDAILDGDQTSLVTVSVDAASSDNAFDAVSDTSFAVVTTDDDLAGFTIQETGGTTSVDESGSTDVFTVVLDAEPASNVVIDLSSANVGEATILPTTLSFSAASWSTPQTITVTGVDELIDDGDAVTRVSLQVNAAASDDDFDALPSDSVLVTTVDDDTAGWIMTPSGGGTAVSETGTTDDFTIVLTSEPVDTVVLTLLSSDVGEVTVSPGQLTFSPTNWNVAQTVIVTGVDDVIDDGTQFSLIAVGVSQALSDAAYDPLPDQTIQVTTTDDDAPAGFTITAIGATTVTEAGGQDDFTVVLDTEPASDVVIDISSGDVGEATVSPATLTFTAANWDAAQTVTLTGQDDSLVDGDQVTPVTVSVNAPGSDDTFDALPDQSVSVTTTDDDVPGFTVAESSGTSLVGEGGSTDDITVVLNAQPFVDVTISVTSGDLGEVTVAPTQLTFSPGAWDTPQTVTLTGVDDPILDGSQFTTITVAVVDPSSDDNFDPVADQTVSVQTTDNDLPGVSVAETSGSTVVTEAGSLDSVTVVLDSEPILDVVLDLTFDATEVTPAPATLTFTNANWDTPQTVALTGVDDFILDGDVVSSLDITVNDPLSDNAYDGLSVSVSITTLDDDGAGFTLTESGGSTSVSENGTSDTFTLVLDAQPSSAVTLDVVSADPGEATVLPVQVTFTPAGWNTAQTVTVTGVDDALTDGPQTTVVTASIFAPGSDDAYDALPPQTVLVTTSDNDVPGYQVVETGGTTTVTEAGGQDQFTIVLLTQPVADVIVDIVGSNTAEAVVSPTTLTFTSANWDTPQTVTVTGVNDPLIDGNQVSSATVSINPLSDSDFTGLASQIVSVTTLDDDAAGIVLTESAGETVVTEAGSIDSITVVLTAQPTSDVVLDVTSADTGEATALPATLTFTPVNWSVPQAVTITGVDELVDDGDRATDVTIAVNTALSDNAFDALPDQVVSVTTRDDDVAGITVTQSGGGTLVSETGTTDDVSVVLNTQPVSNVVLTVVSANVGEATVSPVTLVFTPGNWSTLQTITVTGVDDYVDDGDQFTSLTIDVDDPASDDAFDSLLPVVVTITTTDNDAPAGVTVTAIGGVSVTEAGSTDNFTVVLDAQPGSDVVIDVTSPDLGEVTVSPVQLTFTNGTWDTPQTVTVTGVDDDIIDGTQSTLVTIAVNAPLSDPAFGPVAAQTVSVDTSDDDVAGFVLTESGGSTLVNESGTTDDITVVLTAEPVGGVDILVSSSNTAEATVSPATVSFTSANWDTPQTVTVTGIDDSPAVIDGDQISTLTFSVDDPNSDDNFDPLPDQTVSATTTDDDVPGLTVMESGGSTIVSESGTTDTFDVVLNSGPTSDVVITVTSGNIGEATVAPSTLTFTPANWFTAQTVTVTGFDDNLPDGDQITIVTVAVDDANSDDNYDGLSQTVSVTTIDDDVAGFTIVESGGLTVVDESGTTDDFTVVLDAAPTTAVSLDLTSADVGEVTISPSTLTFTNANWNVAQTVTVSPVDDDLIDGTTSTDVTLSVDVLSSAPEYGAVVDQTVSVDNGDDDLAGFTVTPSGPGTLVTEAGSTDVISVVLDAQPVSDVVIDVASADVGEVTIAPAQLTFTPAGWDTPQDVTVTGVDDDLIDGDQSTSVTFTVNAAGSDDDFDALPAQSASVTTTDDDVAGFLLTESGGGTQTDETGATDDITVALTAQPLTDVVLTVTSADPAEVTLSTGSLTFTAANWDTPQTVTVTGVDEAIDDGDRIVNVTFAVDDPNSDDDFDPVADQVVAVTNVDDDTAGLTVVQSGGGTLVSETGTTDDFTVALASEPTSDVVLDITSADIGEVTASPAQLTFTTANWNAPQTVTVTGIDDILDDGDQFTDVTISVNAAGSDDVYDPVPDATVSVTTTDNESPVGVTVTAIGGTTVTEAGGTDDFTVVLDAPPASDVVIDLTSADVGEVTVGPAQLTFTTANWDTPQTVTVTGVDDDVIDGTQSTLVTLSINAPLSDPAYGAVADQTVSVDTSDDDVAGFVVTESGGSTVVNESGTTDDITVVLTAEPVGGVDILVSSSNTAEATVAPSTISFSAANWDTPQTVTVTGVDDTPSVIDGDQISILTFSVDDPNSDDDWDPLVDQTVSVTTTDDDISGLTVTPSGGATTVSESGSTDTFDVVLNSGPTLDVVLNVSSGDTGEATVAPSTLTFTAANWDTPQTVTVTGVDDFGVDGDQVTIVTVAVDDALSDDSYDGLSETTSVTTTDNDGAGINVTESGGSTQVAEPGTTDSFDVVLNSQPSTNVVITVTSTDLGEGTVSPATLTFTNGSWDTPQTVIVTAQDDALIDGDQLFAITLAVDDPLSDDQYDPVADVLVSVTNIDDDVAGITVTESGGGSLVTEAGGTDDFTVVLQTQPTANVVIDIASTDLTEVTVLPAQITFTPANWDTPQTVTLTGVDDDVIDPGQLTPVTLTVNAAASDDAYDPIVIPDVTVTTADDDVASFILTETNGDTEVAELGSSDQFTVELGAQPATDVVLDVTVGDLTEAVANVSQLTFTAANWDTPQTVTLTSVDDQIDDGNVVFLVTVSVDAGASDNDFDALPPQSISVTNYDNDTAGFTVTESGGTTSVTEAGGTDDFTVVLDTEPVSNVELLVSSADLGEATVAPTTLVFTPATWAVPQTVTVTGVDDLLNDSDQITAVTISVNDGPSDDTYDPLADQTVSVTTVDDDQAGFTIVQTNGGTSVNESGTSDDFTVVLTSQPGSNVVLTITNGDPSEVSISPTTLTFTNANWDTPQTVTATGVDDAFDDGDRFTLITLAVDDANSDDAYDPLADQTVSVTTLDDDGVGFTIVQSGGSTTVAESGTTDDFTVVLDAQPTLDVVLDIVSNDLSEATVAPASLTFTSANWDTPQSVTVTGVDDPIDDGDVVSTITVSVNIPASDDVFDPVAPQDVGVTTTNDDAAALLVTESAGSSTVDESGTTDTFTVELTVQPASNVVLSVSSQQASEVGVAPISLTFTNANWNTPQTVTLNGVDDDVADGPTVTAVVVSVVDVSSDDAYDPVADVQVLVTNTDDDVAGFTVVESGGTTQVSEGGSTDAFTVVLDTEPVGNVVLSVTASDPTEATANTTSLFFTPINWDTPQTVTLTGIDDAVDDGDQLSTITLSINDGASDDAYDPLPDQSVTVTTVDDDAAGFTIVESSGSTIVTEAGSQDLFTVVLDSEPVSDVVLTVTSPDVGEVTVAPATLTFTTGNWATPQTLTVTGVDDALTDGDVVTNLIVSVDDGLSDDTYDPLADQSVAVTTTDDDVAGFSVTESGGATTVTEAGGTDTFDVVLDSRPATDVVFDIVSTDIGEVTVGSPQLTFTNANWSTPQTVVLTGVDDVAQDGPQVTTVTVAVNAALSDNDFDALGAASILVTTTDDDAASFSATASGGTTSVDETGTTDLIAVVLGTQPVSDVVVTASSADLGEATVSPSTLTFTSANWDTPQNITVTGVDDVIVDGSQATLITIAIDDANSDDAFDPLADQVLSATTTDDDAPGFTLAESLGSTSVAESGTTDDFTIVLDRQPLTNVVFDVASVDPGEATTSPALVTFTPANWNTPQTVTVTGVDDAVDDGDVVSLVTVTVSAPNSDDAFDAVPAQSVSVTTTDDDTAGMVVTESSGSSQVDESGTTDDLTVVLTSQPTSTVILDVTSGDVAEVAVSPSQLTFTPADWDQAQTVTLTGVDDPDVDGPAITTVTISVNDPASDDVYDPVADATVSVTTTDDDAAGFTITESGSTTVNEAGTTDNFTVVLDVRPTSNVVITLSSADVGEATLSPTTLTFTTGTWDTPQTVTVTGVDDLLDDGDQNTTVTLAVDDANSDDAFDPLPDQTLSVTTIDDDGAGFTIVESSGGTSVTEAGSTDSFTVVLTAQPATPVRLNVTSGDLGEAITDVTALQYTPGNWDTPQTVTVTGVDDLNDDGNQTTSVTVSVDDASSDDVYDPVPNQIVSVITTDDDIAGFTITQTGGATLVSEAGSTDTFTIVLTAEPVLDVVLTVTAGDPTEASVAPTTLTFTAANWTTPQTVTVTGVDDAVVDNIQFSTVTLSVDDANSDDAYDPLADQFVSVTTTDDESAAYTATESGGSSLVTEAGSTDDVTVVLLAQPFGDVVFDVVSSDVTEVTANPPTLTFNNGNWDTPQTVTLTGVNDDVDDGDQSPTVTISVNAAATEDSFDGMAPTVVTVTVTDDDTAGFTITETGIGTSVAESGTVDAFDVVLDAQPLTDVVLDVTSGDTGEATVSSGLLTFTSATWSTPQTVTVTGVDDLVDDGDIVTLVTVAVNAAASDNGFDALPAQTVSVTTTDDDGAGLTITESGGTSSVDEAGTTDTFDVVLDARPLLDVVLDVASADAGEVTATPAQLTFTTGNWDTPQTVTVTGIDDVVDDGDQVTLVTATVNAGLSDDAYDPVPAGSVSVTTVDDDGASFSFTESGGGTSVDESGTSDAFTVSIGTEPVGAVVIDVASSDTGEATALPAQLTFTSANWTLPQTVTVTGVDDGSLVDGPVVSTIGLSINVAGSDAAYDVLPAQQVNVTTTDDDLAGFAVVESTGSTIVDESGTTDDFTVVLTGQPETSVVVDVTSGDTGEATVGPTTLTFTNGNWDTPQTVTVTGVDDAPLLDGDQTTVLTISIDDALSNDGFDPLADQTVSVTTTDNEVAGYTLTELGGTTVSEAGTTDDFTIVLDVQPTANVVFTVVSGDTGEATVAPATLTFTAGNWNTPQSVIVTGVADTPLTDGDQLTTITVSVDAPNSYDPFDGLADQTVVATTTDIDVPGVLITESAGSTLVGEGGSTDTFSLELTAQPVSNVTIDVTSGDTGEATVDLASLVFTAGNWDTPQTVTVTGVSDSPLVDGDQITIVTIAVDDANSDDLFDPIADQTINVTTTDADTPDFTVTESGGTTIVNEDGAGNTDTFDVVLDAQPTLDVVITVSSGSPGEALASPTSLTFTNANWNTPQIVTVTGVDDSPLADGTQLSTVTLSIDQPATDDAWDSVGQQTVSVSTTDTDIPDFLVTESGGSTPVTEAAGVGNTDDFTVVLQTQPDGPVIFDISSADTGEATVSPSTLVFGNGNWNTPQTVTVTGVDDALIDGPVNTLVTVAINQPGTTPLFDGLPDQTVTVTTLDDDVAGFTVAESGGTSVTEAGSNDSFTVVLDAQPASLVVFTVTSTATDEVAAIPPTLTFLSSNWDTPQTVFVSGVDDDIDDGNQITSVVLSVDDVNSDNAFDPLADQSVLVTTVDDDAAGLVVLGGPLAVTEAGGNDTFTVELASEPLLDVVLNVSVSDATEALVGPTTLTFTSADWDTPQTVTVTGVDDDVIDGDVASLVTIAVDDGLSDDTYDPLPDEQVDITTADDDIAGLTIVEEAGMTTVTEAGGTDTWTVVLDAAPTSDVVISVTSAALDEVTVLPATLTFTSANWDTPQTVTATGVDDGFDDGDQVTVVTAAVVDPSSDNAFDGLSETVNVTTLDDDVAGITLGSISGNTAEDGTQATFTIVLDAEPTASVTVSLASGDPTEGSVAPVSVVFTSLDWATPQTVFVTGLDDAIDDGPVLYSIVTGAAVSSDPAYSGFPVPDVVVTNDDDDTGGINIGAISGSTDESGASATFTISLASEPTGDVTIALSSSDMSEGTVSPLSVTFTSVNWNSDQTVTITGVSDDIDDGDIAYTVITAPASSTDPGYNGLNAANVAVTNVDDDVTGITVGLVSGPTTEAGGQATFTVVLDSEPTANVSIGLTSDDTSEGTVSPSSLTFTSANWSTPQTVTVTGVDDVVADGSAAYNIITAAATSADPTYSGLNAADVAMINTDDETAGITVSPSTGLTTTEAGGVALFTVILDAQPAADVTIALSSTNTLEGTVSPSSLTFTTANWNTARIVTVTGVDDDVDDGDIAYTITTGAATSTDPAYSGVDPTDVSVTNANDDVAGITVTGPAGSTSEAGGTTTVSIVLDSEPTADVEVDLTSSNTSEGTLSVAFVILTPLNWNTPQVVTLTGVDDDVDDGDVVYTMNTTAATSTDPKYAGIDAANPSVTNTDDDTAGVTVGAISGPTTEASGTATFSVVLDSEPTADVTIGLSSNDLTEGIVAPGSLTFTSANWDTQQIVTITGQDDSFADGDVAYTIVTANATSTDPNYSGFDVANVAVTNTDDEVAGWTVTEVGGNTVTSESGSTQNLRVVLTAQPETNVVVTVTSADTGEIIVNTAPHTFTSANWNTPFDFEVEGVPDGVNDGDQFVNLTVSVDDPLSADPFDSLADVVFVATNVDIDPPQ